MMYITQLLICCYCFFLFACKDEGQIVDPVLEVA